MFSAFCWFGQMMNQTLNHMIVPSHMPTPIRIVPVPDVSPSAPRLSASTR